MTSQRLGGTRVAFVHARTPTHSPPDVITGRGNPRSLYKLAEFVHVLVLLAAGFALCFGKSINLT